MRTIYLAMPITGRSYDEVVEYITSTARHLEMHWYEVQHPMTGKGNLRNEKKFVAHGYEHAPASTNHAIFERDKWMVQNSDIIFLNYTDARGPAIGMTMELAWASAFGVHSIVVLPKDSPYRHAFILEAADIIYETYEEAMEYLFKLGDGDF